MNQRPLAVTLIGCVYLVIGAIGFAYHVTEFKATHPFQYDIVWVELLCLIAIVCGLYILRGSNWARWLALVWIAYHGPGVAEKQRTNRALLLQYLQLAGRSAVKSGANQ